MVPEKLPYWIGFSKVPGIGPTRLRALLDYYGDIEQAWLADLGELRAIGLDKRSVENLARVRPSLDLEFELKKLDEHQVSVLTWEDEAYPKLLKTIYNPPIVLYIRGQLTAQDDWALAVVGTRRATVYGKECTRTLVRGLVENKLTIVSGLAYGIDTEAHRTAVEVGGRTIAVLGSGVDVIYPAENRKLSQAIIEQGSVISEYPLGTKPEGGNFPYRNRIISGLSLGTLIVEGAIQSGARITADNALEQGREVFAVPGSILSKGSAGPNYLIKNGAVMVTHVNDILEELNLMMIAQQTEARSIIPENDVEAILLAQLSAEPLHVDDLGAATHLSAAEIASTLTIMELKGIVRQVGGMNYILAREKSVQYVVE